ELEAFSYTLTHDLRAPVRAIQSFLQILLEDHGSELKDNALVLVNKVIGSTQRMDRMILDLLTFTRLSHEAMPLEAIEVENIIRDIIHYRPEFQPPNAKIDFVLPLCRVMGNEAAFKQCLTNLLDNAVKFVRAGEIPQIKIYSRSIGSTVLICIEDNGIGISSGDQAQLFRMFSRLHGNQYPGNGIGLALVRKAVERMGGSVGVESEAGKGSRFRLQLSKAL
ncbi:MAG TPA: HAMP domain-containing sensor histidine kinase, partial [Candidatus Methylacidiphilales bacterium]|nr:HAMP domain-containing sensor histidine kinase [Candidatus Methylacidiphilales bacterium]